MKIRLLIIFISFSSLVYGQGDFSFLKREIVAFNKKDTVMIFGSFNNYSGSYVLFNAEKCKFVSFISKQEVMEKVFDSSASCIECSPVVDFAKNNVNAILSNFDSSYHFWLHPRVVNGKTVVSFASHIGPAYFMGIYFNNEMNYIFFEKSENINYVFGRGAYYYWMYFNLLKNQWALYPW